MGLLKSISGARDRQGDAVEAMLDRNGDRGPHGAGEAVMIAQPTTRRLAALLVSALGLTACPREPAPATSEPPSSQPSAAVAHAGSQPASTPARAGMEHDPSHPPIDCPLHAQGLDPSTMRPFEEVEKYIAFLERADRTAWQRPDTVVAALRLFGDETVLDLGAGSGYFAFRLARALPRGRVIAADIEPEMIRHMHHRAMSEGVSNLEAKLIQPSAPAVPAGVDLVFICDVLHHVADRPTWLASISKALAPGARLVLIEFKEGELPEGPPEKMKIPRAELVKLVTDAGLVLASEHGELLPYQTFLEFKKP
ncbi:MAG: class I SAM-dependent methyltransferase [Pseudomonadota bacterium]